MDLDTGPSTTDPARPDLVAAAGVGIMSIDTLGRILSANAAAIDILVCRENDLIGRSAHAALNGDLPADECELERSAHSGIAAHVDEDTFRAGDGTRVPVWWATTPLRSSDTGALAGAVLVFGDRTAQRDRVVAEQHARERGEAALDAVRRDLADMHWLADVTRVLSSTLDEREVLERLARLTAGRLADIAVTDLIVDDSYAERIGVATGDGVIADVDHLVDDRAADGRQLVVPLTARGRTVGTLLLHRLDSSPPFSELDALVATDIGRRAALATDNARLYRAQTDISSRLQQALLPTLPTGLSIDVAVRYLPAHHRFDVGGDWYDVFRADPASETMVLVIGDVAGHDLEAGTTMSAVRNLLRGIVVATGESPSGALHAVDANMTALGIGGTASALVMCVSPVEDGRWKLTWSNAGHMPPLLITTPTEADLLETVHGTLLGAGVAQQRTESELIVPAGSTVVLYTDGLVENRNETIDTGLLRLRRAAMTLVASTADSGAVADELLARNEAGVEDDTAMLVCHLPRAAVRD